MHVSKFIYVLAGLWLLVGCDHRTEQPRRPVPASPPTAGKIAPPPAAAEFTPPPAGSGTKVAIPLDDVVDGKISLTRNFYFIFDGSGSMGSPPPSAGDKLFVTKLAGAKWAVDKFMGHVPKDVNFGLWIFDSKGSREVVPLGPDKRGDFLAAIQDSHAGGVTPLAEAIHHGVDQLVGQYKRQLGYGEYRLVVVTDGQADGIPNAATYADELGIPIYTIGFCVSQNHPLRERSVSYRTANSAEDLREGLKEVIVESKTYDPTEYVKLE